MKSEGTGWELLALVCILLAARIGFMLGQQDGLRQAKDAAAEVCADLILRSGQ